MKREDIVNPFDFPATKQQEDAVLAAKQDTLKIEAVAGASKTSTCQMIAANYLERSLYLAFNKKMATEAESKFDKNYVECRTTHSIAFRKVGVNYGHKLSRPVGRYRNVAGTGSEIARYFKIPDVTVNKDVKFTSALVGLLVKQCVAKFEQSADSELNETHIPKYQLNEQRNKYKNKLDSTGKKLLDRKLTQLGDRVLEYSLDLWDERVDTLSPVLITHDTYLKLYQLGGYKLDYKRIYLDEAQDTSPCVMDIFLKQKDHAKLVMVGDSFQQIYAWRGAVNALSSVGFPVTHLTKSFRYGKEVADIAREILGNKVTIEGNEALSATVGDSGVINTEKPYTMVFRNNATLLTEAVFKISQGDSVSIEVDTTDFIKKLESAVALFKDDTKKVKHEEIVPYSDWSELVTEAKHSGELCRIKNLVETEEVFKVLEVLKTYIKPTNPHIIMSTAHKIKGLEFDQVWLAEDFPSAYSKGRYVGLPEEERNLLYVAVTRAKKVLEYNSTVLEVLEGYSTSKGLLGRLLDEGL